MKRVILIHGWSGSPDDNWLPWLKTELEKLGHEVLAPSMPDTDHPVIGAWVRHLSEVVGMPDAHTYFIGHSIGCQAILRYLEGIGHPVGGAVFVAGWFNLENMEEGEEEIARPWIETPIVLAKIKAVLPKSTLIISNDDPYGAFEENRKKFAPLVTKEIVLPHVDHITDLEYPIILSESVSMLES